MLVNKLRNFAIFDSRNKETTLFLNRKEIVVSFLVLENPSQKSGVKLLFRIFFKFFKKPLVLRQPLSLDNLFNFHPYSFFNEAIAPILFCPGYCSCSSGPYRKNHRNKGNQIPNRGNGSLLPR